MGSWQSWIGTNEARRLLGEVDFLKLAHHGSENAHLSMSWPHSDKRALLSWYRPKSHHSPPFREKPLLNAVEKRCFGHVAVRSDWVPVDGAPNPPKPPRKLPKGFKKCALGIDYQLEV